MFASQTKKTIEVIDGDAVVSVVIRKLSARALEKAGEARQRAAADLAKGFGADLMRVFREGGETPTPQEVGDMTPEQKIEARYALYDRAKVLEAGVGSWAAVNAKGKPLSVKDGLDDLDEETTTLLHREILDLSLGPIDEEEAEAQRGKR